MSVTRPQRRVSGSTRNRIASIPPAVVERIVQRRFGFSRRDINSGPVAMSLRWVAMPTEGEVAL